MNEQSIIHRNLQDNKKVLHTNEEEAFQLTVRWKKTIHKPFTFNVWTIPGHPGFNTFCEGTKVLKPTEFYNLPWDQEDGQNNVGSI